MNFRARLPRLAPPAGDVLVWDLAIPAGAIGVVAGICDGYGGAVQLRTKAGGGPGAHLVWVAPAFRAEAEELLALFARNYGVGVAGPRPFGAADFAAGTSFGGRDAGP